jgi:ABC-type multidrug transport system fused ATPase/permease subunit
MEFAVELGSLQDKFKEMEVNAHRVFQLTDTNIYQHDVYGTLSLPSFNGRIEFKNVNFEYEKDHQILNDVSFTIEPNSHIAFVGESGCGKSTIVSLICRLYNPTTGIILFDETNSTLLDQNFNRNVAMINQSPYLFDMTIRDNMQLVKADATDEEIYDALKLANAYEFVSQLPEGLDSSLGEGGTRLSGGQKQRICIARALLKKSKVLIFDESTSALDNISQEHVMESVEQLKKNTTIITIAHRLSTIENCDKIYFIDKGQIIDSGTHKELLQNNKKYSALYNKQKKEKQLIEDENIDIVEP